MEAIAVFYLLFFYVLLIYGTVLYAKRLHRNPVPYAIMSMFYPLLTILFMWLAGEYKGQEE